MQEKSGILSMTHEESGVLMWTSYMISLSWNISRLSPACLRLRNQKRKAPRPRNRKRSCPGHLDPKQRCPTYRQPRNQSQRLPACSRFHPYLGKHHEQPLASGIEDWDIQESA